MSRTDADGGVPEWVPQLGWLDLSDERRELIKGLYRLAAWVAKHRDLPVPAVSAFAHTPSRAGWSERCAVVDRVAAALGSAVRDEPGSRYGTRAWFGPVELVSAVYRDSVGPAAGADRAGGLPDVAGRGGWTAVSEAEFGEVIEPYGDVPDGGRLTYDDAGDGLVVFYLLNDALGESIAGGPLPLSARVDGAYGPVCYRLEPAAATVAGMLCDFHEHGGPCIEAAAGFERGIFVCAAHTASANRAHERGGVPDAGVAGRLGHSDVAAAAAVSGAGGSR